MKIFDVAEVTEEQAFTLAMLGSPMIIENRETYYLCAPTREQIEAQAVRWHQPHVLRWWEPVVMHRGRRRVITQNGDLISLEGPSLTDDLCRMPD